MNTQQRAEELAANAKAIIDRAELEGRGRTPDEDFEVARVVKQVKELRAHGRIDQIGRQIGVEGSGESFTDGSPVGGRPGDAFVKSEQYRKIADPAARSSRWSSGPGRGQGESARGHPGSPGTGGALVQNPMFGAIRYVVEEV